MSKGIATTITIKMDDVLPEAFYAIHETIQEALASRGFLVAKEGISVQVDKAEVRTIRRALGA